MQNNYINVFCPKCKTTHVIRRTDKNKTVKCLCGAKLLVSEINGKYDLVEV